MDSLVFEVIDVTDIFQQNPQKPLRPWNLSLWCVMGNRALVKGQWAWSGGMPTLFCDSWHS